MTPNIAKSENDVLFSNDTGILGKRNSEFSQQESNLRPSDFLFPSMPVSLLNNTSFSFIHHFLSLPNLLLVIFHCFSLSILLDPEQPVVGPADQSSAPSLPPTNLEQGPGELVQSDEEEEEET